MIDHDGIISLIGGRDRFSYYILWQLLEAVSAELQQHPAISGKSAASLESYKDSLLSLVLFTYLGKRTAFMFLPLFSSEMFDPHRSSSRQVLKSGFGISIVSNLMILLQKECGLLPLIWRTLVRLI